MSAPFLCECGHTYQKHPRVPPYRCTHPKCPCPALRPQASTSNEPQTESKSSPQSTPASEPTTVPGPSRDSKTPEVGVPTTGEGDAYARKQETAEYSRGVDASVPSPVPSIAATLADHFVVPYSRPPHFGCFCGDWRTEKFSGYNEDFRAHLATVIEAHYAPRLAAAWEAGVRYAMPPDKVLLFADNPYTDEQPSALELREAGREEKQ